MHLRTVVVAVLAAAAFGQYQPNWDSLDARPLPAWYDDAKLGIFLHWGVFSVPSFKSEWYWWMLNGTNPDKEVVDFHNRVYGPNFRYADFAAQFKAEFFNPDEWASLFKAAGAKYVVLTSKHHEGFTLYPSGAAWNWNAVDTGPHMDVLGMLATSVRSQGLHFGAYHSLFEWFNPLYIQDRTNKGATQDYVNQILMPELHTLINNYQPEVLWSDGDWEMNDTYWKSTEFLAWLYNESPVKDTVVTNDRWGSGDTCKHGGYWTCSDRYNPGHLVNHKWENCMTTQEGSWGYDRRSADLYHDVPFIIEQLTATVAFGGNLLLNVGPTADGRIVQAFKDRLLDLGAWLNVNGEAIYGTSPWPVAQNQSTSVFYTKKGSTIYAITLQWPGDNVLALTAPQATAQTTVTLLGYPGKVTYDVVGGSGVSIQLPSLTPATIPCKYAWALKLQDLANS